jgi:hypothetical protein
MHEVIMESSAELLLKKLFDLGNRHPEKWKKTPFKSTFLCSGKVGVVICKYFDAYDLLSLSISSVNEHGNTIAEVTIKEQVEPELFKSYLAFYENVKEWAHANAFNNVAKSLALT